jgi:site-specific DNA-methyltransferase (adenine-specific)
VAPVALAHAPEPVQTFGHPFPKPVRAVEALVAPPGGTVLDPFMGVGSTLLAARRRGCPVIGMELEERFCRRARQRLTAVAPGLPLTPTSD